MAKRAKQATRAKRKTRNTQPQKKMCNTRCPREGARTPTTHNAQNATTQNTNRSADTKAAAKQIPEGLLILALEVEVPPIIVMGLEAPPPPYRQASRLTAAFLSFGDSLSTHSLPSSRGPRFRFSSAAAAATYQMAVDNQGFLAVEAARDLRCSTGTLTCKPQAQGFKPQTRAQTTYKWNGNCKGTATQILST